MILSLAHLRAKLPLAIALGTFGIANMIVLTGCGDGVQKIKVQVSNDPLEQARNLLQKYSEGQRLGSESTMFDSMVAEVRKTDKERAQILEDGFKQLLESSGNELADRAKDLLAKLQPSMTSSR